MADTTQMSGSLFTCIATYDSNHNPIREEYLGTDGKPIRNHYAIAGWTADYDALGNLIRGTFYDTDGTYLRTSEYDP